MAIRTNAMSPDSVWNSMTGLWRLESRAFHPPLQQEQQQKDSSSSSSSSSSRWNTRSSRGSGHSFSFLPLEPTMEFPYSSDPFYGFLNLTIVTPSTSTTTTTDPATTPSTSSRRLYRSLQTMYGPADPLYCQEVLGIVPMSTSTGTGSSSSTTSHAAVCGISGFTNVMESFGIVMEHSNNGDNDVCPKSSPSLSSFVIPLSSLSTSTAWEAQWINPNTLVSTTTITKTTTTDDADHTATTTTTTTTTTETMLFLDDSRIQSMSEQVVTVVLQNTLDGSIHNSNSNATTLLFWTEYTRVPFVQDYDSAMQEMLQELHIPLSMHVAAVSAQLSMKNASIPTNKDWCTVDPNCHDAIPSTDTTTTSTTSDADTDTSLTATTTMTATTPQSDGSYTDPSSAGMTITKRHDSMVWIVMGSLTVLVFVLILWTGMLYWLHRWMVLCHATDLRNEFQQRIAQSIVMTKSPYALEPDDLYVALGQLWTRRHCHDHHDANQGDDENPHHPSTTTTTLVDGNEFHVSKQTMKEFMQSGMVGYISECDFGALWAVVDEYQVGYANGLEFCALLAQAHDYYNNYYYTTHLSPKKRQTKQCHETGDIGGSKMDDLDRDCVVRHVAQQLSLRSRHVVHATASRTLASGIIIMDEPNNNNNGGDACPTGTLTKDTDSSFMDELIVHSPIVPYNMNNNNNNNVNHYNLHHPHVVVSAPAAPVTSTGPHTCMNDGETTIASMPPPPLSPNHHNNDNNNNNNSVMRSPPMSLGSGDMLFT